MERHYQNDSIQYTDETGKRLAEMDFPLTGKDEITITHTFVDPSLKGQVIGKELMREVIDYAKRHSLTIKATCSFAIHYFEKNPSDLYKVD